MFRLILFLIMFIMFMINYFYWFLNTIPYLNFIRKQNIYQYFIDIFNNRKNYIDKVEYRFATWDKNYLLDYEGFHLKTDLKIFSKNGWKYKVFVPVIIVHTWSNALQIWDSIFEKLNIRKNYGWYMQIISSGNNYDYIWNLIINWKKEKQTIYLWSFYVYCSLANSLWKDAYLYQRYKNFNKVRYYKDETKIANSYVCPLNVKMWEYKLFVCTKKDKNWNCIKKEEKTYSACNCFNKGEYSLCLQNNSKTTNPSLKKCENTLNCMDYIVWTINLNTTNCSLSWLLQKDLVKSKYFLIR